MTKRLNSDGSRYYSYSQSLMRAFLAGLTFGAFPRDYGASDDSSSWTRIQDAITRAEQERSDKPKT
ncbi:MAG: hypothetical protein UW38_C0001G0498 [Candidatus Saccharibacteria bacterium GW2011_GWC2_44_17]|nr:MAG: hypothetical protein UW38_C0001G0498 [Candidatus Saccharibacteria bacterium GW2011_GWC2_44_17]MBH1955960.1 hypothetical protein [Candidatus Saccharibacteria bacterium]MBH1972348.1 hypothetical protein [Candidatus Saccharibacteria bacterium]MBH1990310.1 hypothetical protein [Candidatus Saccharibacteria bacterium]